MTIDPGGVSLPAGTTADIAAQMAAVTTNDQTATHPTWNAGDPVAALYALTDVTENIGAVVPEPADTAEDAAWIDPGDAAQLATGLPDADDLLPTFPPRAR